MDNIERTKRYLAGNNLISTYKSVENSLRQSHRVLKKAGRLLIIDAICPRMVQGLENILFSFSSLVLDLWDKPMVYYFSLSGLIQILGKVGFKEITFSYLDTGSAQLRPFTSSAGIPFKYTPLCHVLIEGTK